MTSKKEDQLMAEIAALRQRVAELELEQQQREVELAHWLAAERENWALADALNQTGAAISSTLRGEEVLDRILDEMSRVVACDAACLLLVQEDVARVYRWRGYVHTERATPKEIVSAAFKIDRMPILQTVRETGRPLAVSQPANGDAWVHKFGKIWVNSYACAPIRSRGKVVGFLTVDSETAHFFEPADANSLQAFADQAALALENVGLHNRVREEIIRRLRTLKKERNFISTVLGTTDALVVALDREGRIVHFNRACEQTSGYSMAEVKNHYVWELLPPEAASTAQAYFTNSPPKPPASDLSNRLESQFEAYLVTKTGQQRLIAWSNATLLDKTGAIEYVIATGIDITKQRQAEMALHESKETLRLQNEQLQVRNRELNAYARTVAHDLKNPLGVLTTMAEVLAESYTTMPPEQLGEYLQSMARSGHKAGQIVEALLLLAGVRERTIILQPIDMAGIVAEALERLAQPINQYQAELIAPPTWPTVLGYAPWVEEVWVNYISNGLKYGGQPPRLELGVTLQDNDMVRFWIKDNGPGLTPEAQAQLFTEFTQLEPGRADGYGLGLSIVRRIVEKLGGQVSVESQDAPGQGSIFSFTLPLADNFGD